MLEMQRYQGVVDGQVPIPLVETISFGDPGPPESPTDGFGQFVEERPAAAPREPELVTRSIFELNLQFDSSPPCPRGAP